MADAVPSDHDIIRSLGEDLPVGLWVARAPTGEQVYTNRRFLEIMGVGMVPSQAGGYAAPYGICSRDGTPYPEARMPFTRAMAEQRVVMVDDITIRRPDGSCVDVRAFARPVGEPISHVVVCFFDITREVEAERARAESERRLQAVQRLEAIGTLAGGIAHDFNNLIFGVKLIVADLVTREADPKRLESLALIDDITERSAALTRSLLGFARRGQSRCELLVLDDVVASMTELLRRTLVGVSVEFHLGAGREGPVTGDASQLEQIVMNLAVNARDAVEGRGHVIVRTRCTETHVVLEVSDNGPGIPEALRDRVFEPYFTTKTKGAARGAGLGLATVFGIVQTHGGSVESDLGLDGVGATLRVSLPWTRGSSPAPPIRAERAGPAAPRATGVVLVVDDDAIVRRAVAAALGTLGYRTVDATGGADAVARYRAHRDELTAVLLDMAMPGMGGRATYLALCEIDSTVAVLLMSGYTHNEEVQEILDLGVRGFVSKPYSVELLGDALAALHAPA